jgi:hypothetical protein
MVRPSPRPTALGDYLVGQRVALGDADTAKAFWDTDERRERLRRYRYLFLSRSKPNTHLRALSRLTENDLKKDAPPVITALVSYIRQPC